MTELTTASDGAPAQATDKIMLVRANGTAVTVTIAELAATFQAALSVPAGAILGRVSSAGAGGPQTLATGAGIAVAGGTLVANGNDHLGLNLLPTWDGQAEFVVNAGSRPSRAPASMVADYFAGRSPPPMLLDENGSPLRDQNGMFLTT